MQNCRTNYVVRILGNLR